MLYHQEPLTERLLKSPGLNAPYGARCFLIGNTPATPGTDEPGLNAPYGARCFLTSGTILAVDTLLGLNAPYGARCFLTHTT